MNSLYASLGATIFDVMSGLAAETGAVNLGQGFPEQDGPRDIREFAAQALLDGPNQYPPMRGLPVLREAIAAHYGVHQAIDLDWTTEIVVTSGATEALAAAILAAVEPGDEVVLFEPMYDSYLPMVRRAGGVPRFVRLDPPDWRIDETRLAAAFSAKTRAVILNTPLNPAAGVFLDDDLALIAKYCVKHNAIAISDEVWEHVVFDGAQHRSMLRHLRDRTIKIGSAGKMFSMTGWKVGFACAARPLIEGFAKAHQFLTFTTPPDLQKAVAFGLGKSAAHFEAVRADFERSRDRLAEGLQQEGFGLLPSRGAYFLSIDLPRSGIAMSDADFALRCVKEFGVATIPFAPFYAEPGSPPLVRLCFAKSDDTLDRAVERLASAKRALS